MNLYFKKIARIKNIIEADHETDGDYWLHMGNELIYEILDTFTQNEWNCLKKELQNFKNFEHSIFARAIQLYDTKRNNNQFDIEEIFFTEFVLLNDLEDLECLLFDVMYVQYIKEPQLELLLGIKRKIDYIRNNSIALNIEAECLDREAYVDKVIAQL